MTIQFTLTEIKTKTKQQSVAKVSDMKKVMNNKIVSCDISDLANYLSQGHSFYPVCFDLNSSDTIKGDMFVSSNLLVADIDHGNYSIEQIHEVAESAGLNVAMIYHSQSSCEEQLKYRVLFIVDTITNVQDYINAQKYLIYVFGKDYASTEVIDTSCFDAGRIFFTARSHQGVVEAKYVKSDIQAILAKCDELDITKKHDELIEINKPVKAEARARKKAEEEALINSHGYQIYDLEDLSNVEIDMDLLELEEVVVVRTDEDTQQREKLGVSELADEIVNYIQSLKGSKGFPDQLDINDIKDWVSENISLSKMLNLPVKRTFSCVLHEDNHPSAVILYNKTGTGEVYHCHSCSTTWSAFAFINHVMNLAYNQSSFDTEKMILGLLGIEYGSHYQRNCMYQMFGNLKIIRELIKNDDGFDGKLASALKRDGSLAILKAFVEIAQEQCELLPVTGVDDEPFAHVFVSNEYLQCWLFESNVVKGMKCLKRLNNKVIELCRLGLLERIDPSTLRKNKKESAIEVKLNKYKSIEKHRGNLVKEYMIKEVYYYRVPFLSQSHLSNAMKAIKSNKESGVKKKNSNQKRVAGVNKEVADSIYYQTTFKYSDSDKLFIKDASKFIDNAIVERGYFTEKEVIKNVDKGRNVLKTVPLKQKKCDDLLPMLLKEKGLKAQVVNKEVRALLHLPDAIKPKTKIYIKK